MGSEADDPVVIPATGGEAGDPVVIAPPPYRFRPRSGAQFDVEEGRDYLADPLPPPGVLRNAIEGLGGAIGEAAVPMGTVEDPNVQYPEGGLPAQLQDAFYPERQVRQAIQTIQQDPLSKEAFKQYGTGLIMASPFVGKALEGVLPYRPFRPPDIPPPAVPPPIPAQYQGRFTIPGVTGGWLAGPDRTHVPYVPQERPQVAPAGSIEQTLESIPPLPETEPPPTTADLTRKILDKRKPLEAEAHKLEGQANISRAIGQRVHPSIETRLAQIYQELNYPQVEPQGPVTSEERTFVPSETASVADLIRQHPQQPTLAQRIQQPALAPQRGSVPTAQAVEIPPADLPYAGGQQPSGIANKYIEEQIQHGPLPLDALVSGQGTTPEIATARARETLAKDPGAAFEAARRVGAGKMLPDDPALLHAYSDQLAEGTARAHKASIETPGNLQLFDAAKAAEKAHLDFLQNVLPAAKGQAQRTMVGFQGAIPADLSTFAGMMKELQDFNGGKELTPPQRMQLYQREKKGQRLKAKEAAGLEEMGQKVDATMPKMNTPDKAKMRSLMDQFIDRVTPCV